MIRLLVLALAISCAILTAAPRWARASGNRPQHVFIIVLENEGFDRSFGPESESPWLNMLARSRGKLLTNYYATGHYSLDNYISMISGQAPNAVTQNDCQVFYDFKELSPNLVDGQVVGEGCVYPSWVETVADQLDKAGFIWRAYMEDMKHPCEHPDIGERDLTQKAKIGDQYAARHNPFVYFHSIIDDPKCQRDVVALPQLDQDLKSVATTPNLVFITPNLCNDGHDEPKCVDGEVGGLPAIDRYLKTSKLVDRITASPAFKKDGMLIITFDEADLGKDYDDYSSCCDEKPGPNTTTPGRAGPGGGRTGAIIISDYVKPKTLDPAPYNHYSMLRSIEDLFGLEHLGYAAQDGLEPFGADVYDGAKSK